VDVPEAIAQHELVRHEAKLRAVALGIAQQPSGAYPLHRANVPRAQAKTGQQTPITRGHFVDVKTLSEHLQTATRKIERNDHGQEITPDYLAYTLKEPQITWECFVALRKRFARYGLTKRWITKIYSWHSRPFGAVHQDR
jgi:hypothetical protein